MTPLIFDILIVAAILLSVALGYLRGFVNEVFTIFGWVAAIVATIYFTPVLRVYGREIIEKTWLADLATSSAIFLATLGICSAISYFATRTIHATKLGIFDRILGFAFGVLRAVVLLGMAYQLFSTFFAEDNRPEFVTEAKTLPFLEASAGWVRVVLPMDMALDEVKKSDTLKDAKNNAEDAVKDIKSSDDKKDKKDNITPGELLQKFEFPQTKFDKLGDDKDTPSTTEQPSEKKDE